MTDRQNSWIARFVAADLFQQSIILYAGLYVIMSVTLEYGLGIIGFSKTPFLNAGGYGFSGLVIIWAFLTNRVRLSFFAFHPLQWLILASLGISTLIGIANGNATSYIIAWNVYLLTGVLMFSLFGNGRHDEIEGGNDPVALIFSRPVLVFMVLAALLSIFSKDNLYQYMLMEVMALYAMFVRKSFIDKALGLIMFAAVHLGSNEGFVQVEVNRASILAVGVTGLIFLTYRKMFITIIFLIMASIGGLFYALALDDATIDVLPRNIREAIMLMKGDDIYNHVSSYQRVYEGQKVMEDFEGAGALETLFGKGLGRTVDMSGAADTSVGQHALLGVLEVHNIHFIHFALLHKFGWFGLSVFFVLVISISGMLVIDLSRGRMDDPLFFFYLYIIYVLVFAMPASNHLIGNPIWAGCLGMLCWLRRQPGH